MDRNIYAFCCQRNGHRPSVFIIAAKNPKTGMSEDVHEFMCGACGATLEEMKTEPRGFKLKKEKKNGENS